MMMRVFDELEKGIYKISTVEWDQGHHLKSYCQLAPEVSHIMHEELVSGSALSTDSVQSYTC